MRKLQDRSPLPLRALQVFERAAKYQNFTEASYDLGVTQSAVSRKISELEALLDVQLFRRSGPKLTLTIAGQKLADRMSYALRDIRYAVAETQVHSASRVVTLSMLPSIAAKWLAPRLGLFTNQHPQIDLRISAARALVDLQAEGIDGAIRYGRGDWPGLTAVQLCTEYIVPVCAPDLAVKLNLNAPGDILQAALFHSDIAEDWHAWFRAAGLADVTIPNGPNLSDDTAALQAAISGHGFALGRSLLVADDLAAGRLIAPFNISLQASFSYWFVTAGADHQNLNIVKEWIIQHFAAEKAP